MNKAKKAIETISANQSVILRAISNVDALTSHANDRDELRRMLWTTEDRLWKLKKRMPVSRKSHGRSKNYANKIAEYESLIASLEEAVRAHEEIFLTAKGIKPRKLMSSILKLFANCISEICGKWYVLEEWYKGARNILANIKLRAGNLQHYRFAGA